MQSGESFENFKLWKLKIQIEQLMDVINALHSNLRNFTWNIEMLNKL